MEGILAQVFALYANDSLTVTIKTLFIWDTPDIYSADAYDKLDEFRARHDGNYDGDLAHLLSYDGGGGIAYVNVICAKTWGGWGVAYSGISRFWEEIPAYSWTVMVIAHEMGHNLGSSHTHDCFWGDDWNEAIDCCGAYAGYDYCSGGCEAEPYFPENGGTIMSYCHLLTTGINLSNGFGPLPLARINERIE